MTTAIEQTVARLDERGLPDDTEVRITLAEARQAAAATEICRNTGLPPTHDSYWPLRRWQIADLDALAAREGG